MAAARYTVCIAYSGTEQGTAVILWHLLHGYGASVFLACQDIQGGAEFREELKQRIPKADELVVLVCKAFLDSPWLGWEVGLADGNKVRVSPILTATKIEDVELHKSWQAHFASKHQIPMAEVDKFLRELWGRINERATIEHQTDHHVDRLQDAHTELAAETVSLPIATEKPSRSDPTETTG